MSKKINVIEEIQELTQQIKTNYQEGIDFEDYTIKDKETKDHEVGNLKIISPRLKDFCRRRFNFPLGISGYLNYYKEEHPNHLFYYTNREDGKNDWLISVIDGRSWEYFFRSQKDFEEWKKKNPGNHWDSPKEKNPKNCSVCGKLVFLKEGQMKLWNDECRVIGVMEDGYTCKTSKPFVLAHFHPNCAKEYFAEKEQSNQNNNSSIKEKLLRNLDKLCLDPEGYLANNQYLKTDQSEKEYHQLFSSNMNNWIDRYLKIIIEGEEINLEDWDNSCPGYWEVKKELIKKIKSEIKQNPSEWKIEKGENENYADESNNRLIKHVSGLRHWKYAISYLWGGNKSERIKHWTEIQALINGSKLPDKNNKPTDTDELEIEKIKNLFQKLNIKKISLKNGELIITHNNNNNNNNEIITNDKLVNNSEYNALKNYCREHPRKEISKEQLGLGSNNNTNSEPNKDNHKLVIGLTIGIGATILVGIVIYFVRKRKNK